MSKQIVLIGLLFTIVGASCLSLSANGPWGFFLNGTFCWVPNFIQITGFTLGLLGTILGVTNWWRNRQQTRCSVCGQAYETGWTVCPRCGTDKKASNL